MIRSILLCPDDSASGRRAAALAASTASELGATVVEVDVRGPGATATILDEMKRHDLTVIGRELNLRVGNIEGDRARKPVMVVPDEDARGGSVMLAFDRSSAAERALASFADSGLILGRTVHVVSVDDDGATAWNTANQAVTALAALGITAQLHNVVSPLPIADAVLEQRRVLDAGLIVMGAYAHSRLAHLIWGSVTKVLVERSPVPLFLHH
jgi:nucleotide-binding universal stress UspA family protein